MTRFLVTGGFGFIGSHLVDLLLGDPFTQRVTVIDSMTAASHPANLAAHRADPRLRPVTGDVRDTGTLLKLFPGHDAVLHLAAQSHVDYAIENPLSAFEVNALGTACVLEAARRSEIQRVVYVSTDEVYGPALPDQRFTEAAPLLPSSAYSAGKAAGELMARAYHTTYGLNVVITRGANTFGPRQAPEKLIPKTICRAMVDERIPLYGDGSQVRDWLAVEDHAEGILTALFQGRAGQAYNIAADNPRTNRSLVELILRLCGKPHRLIEPVPDRIGHDAGYAIDNTALLELGWEPTRRFQPALMATIQWYLRNPAWVDEQRARLGSYA